MRIKRSSGIALMALSVALAVLSVFVSQGPANTDKAAARASRILTRRVVKLDSCISSALSQDRRSWMSFDNLPSDFVIYRYCGDTLQSWCNQFPLHNDDLSSVVAVERLSSYRNRIVSPLSEISDIPSFVNYGSKWYIVKTRSVDDCTVVAGLEVDDEFSPPSRRRVVGERFSIEPLSYGTGSAVSVSGVPVFKITSDPSSEGADSNPLLFWFALLLFLIGLCLFAASTRTWTGLAVSAALLTAVMTLVYIYGRGIGNVFRLFSPTLYADRQFLYSLGAVVILNLYITLLSIFIYMARRTVYSSVAGSKRNLGILAGLSFLSTGIIIFHIVHSFRSIVMHSSISLEPFKSPSINIYTGVVYVSFLALAMAIPLLLRFAEPFLRRQGVKMEIFSLKGRIIFSGIVAAYFVITSSVLGFRKEESKVEVWSNRLSMDRDIGLEIQLISIEQGIAADQVIRAVSAVSGTSGLVHNHLAEAYLGRITQWNDISVYLTDESTNNPTLSAMFETRVAHASRIAEMSNFFFSRDVVGRGRYTGYFIYPHEDGTYTSMLLCIDPKSNREDRGYLSLLGISGPGRISIPPQYSYAKYSEGRLMTFKGFYPYPTVCPEEFVETGRSSGYTFKDGYIHFCFDVSDEATIVISRDRSDGFNYIVELLLFWVLSFLIISAMAASGASRQGENAYFRNRIKGILFSTLTFTLIAMSIFSVYFVYRRYEQDLRIEMSSKIDSITALVQRFTRNARDYRDLQNQEFHGTLEMVANTLGSDITIYSSSGKAFMSTTPEVFDRMILGFRLDEDVYREIVEGHNRFVIARDRIGDSRFNTMYAPVFGADGRMVAIISSPFTEQNESLEYDAVKHIIAVITVFLMLILLARFSIEGVVDRLFRPISEMSRKMKVSAADSLEYIEYDRDDEISSLVNSYNKMVSDLAASAEALALAERNNAWTAMAQQVAHEIKNPLTPIKLKLQMLARLKASGRPEWQEKFDEVAAVVLEHIDILASTAGEFTCVANLYSEPYVDIDLDRLLKEEVMMFEGREGIEITYYGLEGVVVSGPKPQLTRVFVNLITNAVQAVENSAPEGGGKIVVSLRKSVEEGFYDIVVEDNGPGVAKENIKKLFIPNFTTKSHGSGIGLALSKGIIDRVKGTLTYSRSFALGGACFTVKYPANQSEGN